MSSLRFQILASFLAVVALASGVALSVTYIGGSRVLEAWVLRSNRFLAHAVFRRLEQGLARGERAADLLASKLADQKDPSERVRLLESFLSFGETFSNGYLFDAAGKLQLTRYRAGSSATQEHLGEDYHTYSGPFPAVADRVLATGKAGWTPIFLSGSGRPQMTRVAALPGPGGKPAGVISLAAYAVSEQVDSWIQGLEPGSHGYVAVLDNSRRVLAASGKLPDSFRAGGVGELPEIGMAVINGREDLVIREPLPAAGLEVIVGLPRDVAFRPLADLRTPAIVALVAALLLGLAGAVLLTRRILRPLEALVGGIRRVGEGVLSHRVAIERDDELGQAATAFNRMAERLHRDQLVEEVWRDLDRE